MNRIYEFVRDPGNDPAAPSPEATFAQDMTSLLRHVKTIKNILLFWFWCGIIAFVLFVLSQAIK